MENSWQLLNESCTVVTCQPNRCKLQEPGGQSLKSHMLKVKVDSSPSTAPYSFQRLLLDKPKPLISGDEQCLKGQQDASYRIAMWKEAGEYNSYSAENDKAAKELPVPNQPDRQLTCHTKYTR